jgi:ABC-2 type transport system permease protein
VARPESPGELRVVSVRPGPFRQLQLVWSYRQLLVQLVRKELKVRYKSSVLGFMWTLLTPALYLVVFSIVFKLILDSPVPDFAVFLLSGLLVWTLFSTAVAGGTGSIVNNATLVQKVWLPRQILPLASIGASLMHFFFQLTVLFAALLIFRRTPAWEYFPLLVGALIVLLVLAAALAVVLSAANVYLRDMQHLVDLVLLAWFWLSAIVYPYRQVADQLGERAGLILLNPIISIVLVFQRAVYNPEPGSGVLPDAGMWWYARNLAIVAAGSVVLLVVALLVFGRLEDDLGEEI